MDLKQKRYSVIRTLTAINKQQIFNLSSYMCSELKRKSFFSY